MFPQGLYRLNTWMDEEYDPFYNRATWQLKFILWPKRCDISNKLLWLTHAYQGTATWFGPGTPVHEYKWHSTQEHIIWKLKGNQ
jgi:hypothetical protein